MTASSREWSTRHSVQAVARRTAALLNALSGEDPAPGAIADLLREHGEAGSIDLSPSDVAELRAAAVQLREVFAAAHVDAAASLLNRLLRQSPGALRLTSHGGLTPWHPHLDSDDDAPWGEWFLASSCMALMVLIWDRQRPPGGLCASPGCRNVYLTQGSGLPRRYCSRRCATRERVASHRRSRAAGPAARGSRRELDD
ncbi:CGNR zinc finger domain-containing protein [Planomonospora parontospora]|uniref:CGNR zinc finger domain-containing protein n=1 Tax=Planomonospora parontospora TaxID=58119 RepID=UPI0027DCCA19|nr:CGNR zinc finger domain-containing protein [Planomonospora parontospora]